MYPRNLKQTCNVGEDDSASQMRPGMDWAPTSTDSPSNSETGALHSTGIIQRRPGPLGQFQNSVVKPILPFLNNLYLRAQRMQHLARNVYVFHMQSIYIARQALHLVIRLNDAVDVNAGPSDEQYDGRNDLEDELIELLEAMTEWGRDKGDEFQYEQCILKIKEQYALLFKDRFYFHDTRDGSTDPLYQKFVAYDEKTIRYRQCQRTHVTSSTTVEINCWTEPLEGEGESDDETGRLVDGTGASAPSAQSSKGLAHQPSRRASKSGFSLRNCHLKRKHRAIATIRIHLAVIHLPVAQIGVRKHGRRYKCRWEYKQRCHTSASLPIDPFTQPVDDIPPPSAGLSYLNDTIPSHEPLKYYGSTQFDRTGQDHLNATLTTNPVTHNWRARLELDKLRSDYEHAMTHATHADKEYESELRVLSTLSPTFPQGEGEVPARPVPKRMQLRIRSRSADAYVCLKAAMVRRYETRARPSEFYDPEAWSSTSTNKFHGRRASLSNSVRPQHHPYRSPRYVGATESPLSPGTSFLDLIAKDFDPHLQLVDLDILDYTQAHPDTAIPDFFLTPDLPEVQDGRGWCLLGNCGVERHKPRLNSHYDSSKDNTRKGFDHLKYHIKDKHFNCAMAPCAQTFSREHDLRSRGNYTLESTTSNSSTCSSQEGRAAGLAVRVTPIRR